jgi:hypothetical protein
MSMIGNFLLASDARLRQVLNAPELVHDVCDEGYESDKDMFVDVDKAWHCLHFLLTGTADGGDPPLNFILTGGQAVGDEDVGYGPARVLLSAEVAQLAKALESIDRRWLVARFDADMMDRLEIYPDVGHWSGVDPGSAESFGYYLGGFESIKALVRRGASKSLGMLVWLS